MMLQCVKPPKSEENERFNHFSRHFTLKAHARRLFMLQELVKTVNIAHHNQYKDGLHSQPVLQA